MGKTDGHFVAVEFSLFLLRTCWNFSVNRIDKFYLCSLTEAIKVLPNHKYFTTYVHCLSSTDGSFHSPGPRFEADQNYLVDTKLHPTTLGTKTLFTMSQQHLWITKTSTQGAASHCNQRSSIHGLIMHFHNMTQSY